MTEMSLDFNMRCAVLEWSQEYREASMVLLLVCCAVFTKLPHNHMTKPYPHTNLRHHLIDKCYNWQEA